MYPAVSPDDPSFEERREQRIRMWRDRLSPPGKAFPGDPRGWEQKYGKTAALTPLGRKLLGLDLWEQDG